jgi:cytochrome c-type biogenesis protein CcmH
MIWVAALALAALTLAPLGLFTWRGGRLRGRQEAALALHRAQLAELDRDLAEGRLLAAEHEAAKLEVQRRLLADAALPDGQVAGSGRGFVLATVVIVPLAAGGLYLTTGHPGFPPKDVPPAGPAADGGASRAADAATMAQAEDAINQLRTRIMMLAPGSPQLVKDYEMLGNVELALGRLPEAAEAWQHVLDEHFEPGVAAELAEVKTDIAGHVTAESLALYKRALAAAPADAPWRRMAEQRIAEGAGG